jgi:UDP-N-acetylglucosamine acyltransferase
VYGLNKLGLRRRNFSKEDVTALEAAYRLYQDPLLNFSQALAQLEALDPKTEHVKVLVEFLKSSDRGVYR